MPAETIFVIDDDRDLRESVVEILRNNQFTAVGCETAEVALQKIKSDTPRLIIVDNMMPGMGGMSLISHLKNVYPVIKIIMITAFSTVDNAVAAMKIGADDYLSKPFRRDDLLMAVKRNLELLRFEREQLDPDTDEVLVCLSNPIRRRILAALFEKKEMRFMDITRHLKIGDHTKVNFHLKNLKSNNLVSQNRLKGYHLTAQGEKMAISLNLFLKKIS